jgi:hypothetical protein
MAATRQILVPRPVNAKRALCASHCLPPGPACFAARLYKGAPIRTRRHSVLWLG